MSVPGGPAVFGAAAAAAALAGLLRGIAPGALAGALGGILLVWSDLAGPGRLEAAILDLPLAFLPLALGVAMGVGRDRSANRVRYTGDRAAEAAIHHLRTEAEAAMARIEGLHRSEAAMRRMAETIRLLGGRESVADAAAAVEGIAQDLLGRGRTRLVAETSIPPEAEGEVARRALGRHRPVLEAGADGRSAAAVPFDARSAGRFALVASTSEGERPLDDGDRRLLFAVGGAAALALSSADLAERTARAARLDGLTGLLLRNPFMEILEDEVLRAWRTHRDLAVAILDIDRFKSVNDAFGHAAGDEALRGVAEAVRAWVPPEATAGRYGGEEFAVVLPGADVPSSAERFEDLRARIERTCRRPDGAPLTASIGVASVRRASGKNDAPAILHLADKALYRAKEGGRNRVELVP